MADVTVTAANLRIIESIEARTVTLLAAAAITKGQACYENSSGLAALAKADAVATGPVVGIATHNAAAGAAVTLLYHGRLAGFTLGTPGALVYLSKATAGALADAAPTGTDAFVQPIGRIFEMSDTAGTEYLFVDINLAFLPVALT